MPVPVFEAGSGNAACSPQSRRFSRDGRLLGVLLAIAVMAYADLDMTLAYATSVGMGEGNPVARAVMGIQSPAVVVMYKVVCTLAGLSILYRARRSRISEPAAWVVLIVMVWLMCRWGHYTTGIAATPNLYVDAASATGINVADHPEWVNMSP